MCIISRAPFSRRAIRVTAGTMLLALCASTALADAPGVTATEITIGTPMPLSGPVRLVSEPYEIGLRTGINEINDNGGINGRKINFVVEDDAYQPARSLAIAKKLIDRDGIFAIYGCFGTPNCEAVRTYTEQKAIPLATYSALKGANTTSPEAENTTFALTASYGAVSYSLVKYFTGEMGLKNIGFLYQNDDLGANARKGLEKALGEAGLKLGVDVGYERTTTDFSTHILKLRDANPDAVIAMGTAPALGAAIKKANEIGFKPVWGTYLIGESQIMTSLVGPGIDGMVYATDTESRYSSSPEATRVRELIAKYYPDAKVDLLTIQGYAQAKLLGQALEAAGKDPTRESFLAAMRDIDFDAGMMQLNYKDGKDIGAAALKLYRWKGDKPEAVSDWVKIESD